MDDSERQKAIELIREMRQSDCSSGVKNKEETRLIWMYKGPQELVDKEDYLLGKAIDKNFDSFSVADNNEIVSRTSEPSNIPKRLLSKPESTEQVDISKKILEDPLYAIKQKELEARRKLLDNPVKLKQIQKMIMEKKLEKQHRKEQKRKKKIKESIKNITDEEYLDKLIMKKLRKLSDINRKKLLEEIEHKSINSKEKPKKNKKRNFDKNDKSKSLERKKTPFKKRKRSLSADRPGTNLKNKNTNGKKAKSSRKGSRGDRLKSKKHRDSSSSSSRSSSSDRSSNTSRTSTSSGVKRRKKKNPKKRSSSISSSSGSNTSSGSSSVATSSSPSSSSCSHYDSSSDSDASSIDERAKKKNCKSKTEKQKMNSDKNIKKSKKHSSKKIRENSVKVNDFDKGREDGQKRKRETDPNSRSSGKLDKDTKKYSRDGRDSQIIYKIRGPLSVPVKISEKERDAKLREMMENAKIRKEDREKNLANHRHRQSQEEKLNDYDDDFLRQQISRATSKGTMADRIRSNVNNIQRSGADMDRSFVRK